MSVKRITIVDKETQFDLSTTFVAYIKYVKINLIIKELSWEK